MLASGKFIESCRLEMNRISPRLHPAVLPEDITL